ncbi:hypothetical protein IRJ41_012571 [Triplophysa rosa]|uniref:Uncharacterized protein n=1 Tax=Triplophysa rosa TaxID=992332 RepID=A0A9W7WT85_TRIRA|nr:hypothetical protein IRJ41_012571 [Triplophysa rosa]
MFSGPINFCRKNSDGTENLWKKVSVNAVMQIRSSNPANRVFFLLINVKRFFGLKSFELKLRFLLLDLVHRIRMTYKWCFSGGTMFLK